MIDFKIKDFFYKSLIRRRILLRKIQNEIQLNIWFACYFDIFTLFFFWQNTKFHISLLFHFIFLFRYHKQIYTQFSYFNYSRKQIWKVRISNILYFITYLKKIAIFEHNSLIQISNTSETYSLILKKLKQLIIVLSLSANKRKIKQ